MTPSAPIAAALRYASRLPRRVQTCTRGRLRAPVGRAAGARGSWALPRTSANCRNVGEQPDIVDTHVTGQIDQAVADLRSQRLQVGRVARLDPERRLALSQATGAQGVHQCGHRIQPAGLEVRGLLISRYRFAPRPCAKEIRSSRVVRVCPSHFCNV